MYKRPLRSRSSHAAAPGGLPTFQTRWRGRIVQGSSQASQHHRHVCHAAQAQDAPAASADGPAMAADVVSLGNLCVDIIREVSICSQDLHQEERIGRAYMRSLPCMPPGCIPPRPTMGGNFDRCPCCLCMGCQLQLLLSSATKTPALQQRVIVSELDIRCRWTRLAT